MLTENVLVALGGNLWSDRHGPPQRTLTAALAELAVRGVAIRTCSGWYESAPVPVSDQPWYVNGVARVATALEPAALLFLLHDVEREFGRQRREANAARVVDLDLLDYDGVVRDAPPPILPHPRLADRAFVLLPLAEIMPEWRHPLSRRTIGELVAALPPGQDIRRL